MFYKIFMEVVDIPCDVIIDRFWMNWNEGIEFIAVVFGPLIACIEIIDMSPSSQQQRVRARLWRKTKSTAGNYERVWDFRIWERISIDLMLFELRRSIRWCISSISQTSAVLCIHRSTWDPEHKFNDMFSYEWIYTQITNKTYNVLWNFHNFRWCT